MAGSFRNGDLVFLRLNLHPQNADSPVIHRGGSGEVRDVRDSDGTVKVLFGEKSVSCRPEWLECFPGTICVGIKAMLTKMDPFYTTGMMVTDLCFPIETHECFGRMQRNRSLLHQSNLGFSFLDGVNLTTSKWKLSNMPNQNGLPQRIGLVLCEEIWPWNRGQWPNVADYHTLIARSLMSQWGNATCVMVLRSVDGKRLQSSLGFVRRISYHHGDAFNLHYTPLCMDNADPANPVRGQLWCAIVIHPVSFDKRLVECTGQVSIPELVLKTMFSSKCTLQLCAYTGESAIAVMEFLNKIKRLHGIGVGRQ